MQCLFCKKTIPLLRRLKDSEFCSEDHRKQYVKEQSLLALESLVSGDVRSVSRSRSKTLAEAGVGTTTAGSGRGRTGTLSNRRNSAGDPDLAEYEAQQGSAYSAALEAAHHMASGNDGQAHVFNDIEECPTDDSLFDALSNITTDFEPKLPPADELSSGHSTQIHGAVEQTSAAGHRGVLAPIAALECSHWNFPASIPRRRVALILRRKRAELAKLFVSARIGEKWQTSTKKAAIPLSWPGSSGPTISRLALAIEGELTPPPPVIPPIAAALDISFEHVIHGCSMDPAGQPAFDHLSPTPSRARLDLNLAQNPGLALTGDFEGRFIELRSHSGKAGTVPSDWFSPILEPEIRLAVPRLSLPWFFAEFAIGEASEGWVVNPHSVAGFLGSTGGIEALAPSVQPAMDRLTLPAALRTGFALQKAHEGAVIVRPNRPALSGDARFEQEPFSIAQAIHRLQLSSNPLTLSHSERVHMELQLTQRAPESIQFAAAAVIAWTKSEPRLKGVRLKIEGSVEVPPPPMTLSLMTLSLKDAVKLRAVNVVELAASGALYLNPSPVFCASTSTADSFAAPAILGDAFRSSLLARCAITGLPVDPCPWPRIDALHEETRLDPRSPIAVLPSVETGNAHGLIPSAAINLRSSELNQVSLDFVPFTIVPALAASVTLSDSAVTWQLEGQADAPRTPVEPTAPPMAPASPLHLTREPHKGEFQLAAFEPRCELGAIEVALLPQGISTLYNTGLTPPQSGSVGAPAPPAASVPPVSPSELANFIEYLRQASILPAILASERHEEPVRSWKDALAEAEQAAPSLYPVEIPAVLAAAAAAGGAVSWRASSPISISHSLPITGTITVFERTPVRRAPDTRRLEVASRPTGHGRRLRNSGPTPPPPAAAPPAEDVLGQIPAPPILEPAVLETPKVEQAKIETPKVEQAEKVDALENIAENAVPPMAGLAPLTLNKMKRSKAKINQSLGPLQVLIQAAQIPSGLTTSLYEPAARTESVLRQKVQDSKPSRGFFLFWRKAPADLKWITLSLPVVLGVWMMTSGRNHPKPANPIPAPLESSASVGIGETETAALPTKVRKATGETKEALVKGTTAPAPLPPSPEKVEEGSWSKFMQRVTYRSAIAHEEDFRSGLSQWEGRGAWTSTWNYDRNGLLRPGQLALFSPSMEMTDYHLEVTGSLDRRSFGWVFRATDMNNYYGGRLVETRPGPMPTVTLERFIVAGGKKIKSQFFPVPLSMRGESIFTVVVEVAGNSFTTSVQGQIVDSFNDDRLTGGGVGLFGLKGEESRIFRISLTHNNDLFGRVCAMIASRETISPGGRAK